MISILTTAFILGITSNLHCVGMCGPIALSIPVKRTSLFHLWIGILQYNFGRIFTYGLLGLLTGFIGLSIATLGILQWASIFTGVCMIFYAWRKYLGKFTPHFMSNNFIPSHAMGWIVKKTGSWKLILLGALNGILPCGMVYLGLIHALLSPTPLTGMMAMVAFGIGTLPIMLAVVFMANSISVSVRKRFSSVIPYVLTILGTLIILRGANLGVPYLSPSVSQKQTQHVDCKSAGAEMNCCKMTKSASDQLHAKMK
jgi:sulfite exporter TauE/SafE